MRANWKIGDVALADRTLVMGVVNVTPDSFSDGGKFLDPNAAIAHGLRLVEEGADLLDVGGESTRPGGGVYGGGMRPLDDEEEIARVLPVVRGLARACSAPISIDTRKLEVARAALDAGARIVNDVSALSHQPAMAGLIAERQASVCLMHAKGEFASMQAAPHYDDVIGEITAHLLAAASRAESAGVARERIAIDPGIGFGKSLEHNLEILRRLEAFASHGYATLIGASRKSFIGKLTGVSGADERVAGSLAAAVVAASRGARIVRVHDVKPTVEALKIVDACLVAERT